MEEQVGSSWTVKAKQLSQLLKGTRSDETHVLDLLKQLNEFSYPIQGLATQDVVRLLDDFVSWSRVCSGKCILHVAQLVSKLLTLQKVSIAADVRSKLFDTFITSLATTKPQTELLYGSAALLQAGAMEIASKISETLLGDDSLVAKLMLGPSPSSINVQRAALNFVTTLCSEVDVSRPTMLLLLERLLYSLINPPSQYIDPVLKAKLVLSQLKCVHRVLSSLTTLQSYPNLPTLLAALKSNMASGLPGQTKTLASIQPPLSFPPSIGPSPYQPSSPKQKPQSVAGPHSRKKQHRNRSRGKERSSGAKVNTDSGGPTPEHSSDSDSASGGVSLVGVASVGLREKRRGQQPGHRESESLLYSSSESDLSDSEAAPNRLKLVNGRIRFQAHSCLTAIFQKLDRQTSFTYWRSFLPDCPRPPNSPPSLLTCIVKDPTPKCRGGAVSVLCALLEGSRPFLAAADDKPRPTQPFTPYSTTLGNIIRELHRSLLLSLTAESHPTTLTQLIKAVAILVANAPYHQLSDGYITKIMATLLRFSRRKDADVQVACLTCYGAAVSITPPLREVELWLSNSDNQSYQTGNPTTTPWLVQHCANLLQNPNTLAVQTEALQALSALCKFYFSSSLSHCWSILKELYLSHLVSASHPLQQHVLKMLEELLRALSVVATVNADSAVLRSVCEFWEELLGGRLAAYLHGSSEHGNLTSQACNVLSTMGAPVMATLKTPFRTLSLTLPLGLCRDETANSAAIASAIRVIGVFVIYDCLKMDDSFLLDCHSVILHCLGSSSLPVRVQASWALANLTDILPLSFPPPLLASLHEAVAKAAADNDKVKCNAVRAAGNMLRDFHQQVLPLCESSVKLICTHLSKCINSGSMKSRWNACYACHSAFSNSLFVANYCQSVDELLKSLCLAVQKCKNFKVRSNAALALSTVAATYYPMAGVEQVVSVWESLLQALENSQSLGDFSEYKHAVTLRTQVCRCLCHTLAAMTAVQAQKVGVSQQPPNEVLSQYMHDFMQESVKQESGELRELILKARENLNKFSDNATLQELTKLWLQLLTVPAETEVYAQGSRVKSESVKFNQTH